MDNFTITTRLTKNDYAKFMYSELYKKPQFILTTLVGLYLIVTVVLNYLNIIDYYSGIPVYEIIFGVFILLGPTMIVLIAAKGYTSNPSLQHDINYTFGDNGITVQGLTFKSELSWAHIIKQKETGKYLILYSSKKLGNFIDKSKLTLEQMQFIKSKVGQK
jgi:YcxB-like protein